MTVYDYLNQEISNIKQQYPENEDTQELCVEYMRSNCLVSEVITSLDGHELVIWHSNLTEEVKSIIDGDIKEYMNVVMGV